jgi:hypothetical protein
METVSLNKAKQMDDISGKITVRALGPQMQNVGFVETDFTDLADFVPIRYSATNNYISNNDRFRFQGNAGKVGHISERICNVLALFFLNRRELRYTKLMYPHLLYESNFELSMTFQNTSNFTTFSNYLSATCAVRFCSAFWYRDVSVFNQRLLQLLYFALILFITFSSGN